MGNKKFSMKRIETQPGTEGHQLLEDIKRLNGNQLVEFVQEVVQEAHIKLGFTVDSRLARQNYRGGLLNGVLLTLTVLRNPEVCLTSDVKLIRDLAKRVIQTEAEALADAQANTEGNVNGQE